MAGQLAVDAGQMADRNAKSRVSGSSCDAARVHRELAGVARGMRRSSQFFQTLRLGPVEASRPPSSTSCPPIRRVWSDAEFLTPNPSPGRSGDTPDTGPFDHKACFLVDEGLVPRGLPDTFPFHTTTTPNMSQTIGAVSPFPIRTLAQTSIQPLISSPPTHRQNSPTHEFGTTSRRRPPTPPSARSNPPRRPSRPPRWAGWPRGLRRCSWASTSRSGTRRQTAATTWW